MSQIGRSDIDSVTEDKSVRQPSHDWGEVPQIKTDKQGQYIPRPPDRGEYRTFQAPVLSSALWSGDSIRCATLTHKSYSTRRWHIYNKEGYLVTSYIMFLTFNEICILRGGRIMGYSRPIKEVCSIFVAKVLENSHLDTQQTKCRVIFKCISRSYTVIWTESADDFCDWDVWPLGSYATWGRWVTVQVCQEYAVPVFRSFLPWERKWNCLVIVEYQDVITSCMLLFYWESFACGNK